MKFCVISDTHGSHMASFVPQCDTLIHCGDFTNMGRPGELERVNDWIWNLKKSGQIKQAIFVPGNHDVSLDIEHQQYNANASKRLRDVDLILTNGGTNINGIKIWGVSYVPQYFDWAFMKTENELFYNIYSKIPENLDILICHGPPKSILDTYQGDNRGSFALYHTLDDKMTNRPKVVTFGHIHTGRGVQTKTWTNGSETLFINAAGVDINYEPLAAQSFEII